MEIQRASSSRDSYTVKRLSSGIPDMAERDRYKDARDACTFPQEMVSKLAFKSDL